MDTEIVALSGGRQATYEIVGEGDPAIWFEGGPGFNAALGGGDCEVLADRFRCYLVDALGTGGTTPPRDKRQYGAKGVARFYNEVRRALRLADVTLLGHSRAAQSASPTQHSFPMRPAAESPSMPGRRAATSTRRPRRKQSSRPVLLATPASSGSRRPERPGKPLSRPGSSSFPTLRLCGVAPGRSTSPVGGRPARRCVGALAARRRGDQRCPSSTSAELVVRCKCPSQMLGMARRGTAGKVKRGVIRRGATR